MFTFNEISQIDDLVNKYNGIFSGVDCIEGFKYIIRLKITL